MSATAKAYQMLSDALEERSAIVSPAELHGWMTGGLCVAKKGDTKRAISALLTEFSLNDSEGLDVVLHALRELARKQLDDVNMGFMLMLPSDDSPIEFRADSLALWVQGFLAGYALNGGDPKTDEFMVDLVEISQLDAQSLQGTEDETALIEIAEYVRLGVISLFLDADDNQVQ